jgi:hypothetical protein
MLTPPPPQEPRRATRGELWAFVIAYLDLLGEYWDAQDQRVDPRRRALPRAHFHKAGVGDDILLWLFYHGHVEHRVQHPTAPGSPAGEPAGGTTQFHDGSLFWLTDAGAVFADALLADFFNRREPQSFQAAWERLAVGLLVPRYDGQDRLFCWGVHALKEFRQPAGNQELILGTAEELRWQAWFDDPLPRGGKIRNPKVRLHDVIKDLNRRQWRSLVHFRGDGTGTRVGWKLH